MSYEFFGRPRTTRDLPPGPGTGSSKGGANILEKPIPSTSIRPPILFKEIPGRDYRSIMDLLEAMSGITGILDREGQTRVIDDSQSRYPPGCHRSPKTAARIRAIRHPSLKVARISCCVTRGAVFAGFELAVGEHEVSRSRPHDSGETPGEAQAIGGRRGRGTDRRR